jgi:hypothetical protein
MGQTPPATRVIQEKYHHIRYVYHGTMLRQSPISSTFCLPTFSQPLRFVTARRVRAAYRAASFEGDAGPMNTDSLGEIEYAALRATIRERGTARLVLAGVIFIAWAGTVVATAAVITVALSTLVPLLILAAGFEAIFALHTNVERIGRYLQVFHERESGWEHVSMEYGRRFPGGGPDPLFGRLFALAVSVNFLPAALGGTPIELGLLAGLHLAALLRMRIARGKAAKQREVDLERFQTLWGQTGVRPESDRGQTAVEPR